MSMLEATAKLTRGADVVLFTLKPDWTMTVRRPDAVENLPYTEARKRYIRFVRDGWSMETL